MRMHILGALASAGLLLPACTATDLSADAPMTLTRAEVDANLYQQLETEGELDWNAVDDLTLWSAIAHGEYMVSVGYQSPKADDDDAAAAARGDILQFIARDLAETTGTAEKSSKDLLVFDEEVLPVVDVVVDSYETLVNLRAHPDVRYVEPLGYQTEEELQKSSAGCSNDPDNSIPSADFETISPGATVPWNFVEANIPEAWELSTGEGVTAVVIDTGTSPNQPRLGAQFAAGSPSTRSIERVGTFRSYWWQSLDGPDDDCGHGTLMAGTLAAPRAAGGAIVGVAHGANLIAIRATNDVILNGSTEKKGVADALIFAANRSDVRVISMSLGHVFSSSRIADAIRYAHDRGKLIFAAAGTSTSFTNWFGVVFPATMAETVAVTGIDTSGYVRCDTCHAGSAVDFVAIMQRAEDGDRTSLSLAMSGDVPGRVGGSSTATATMAGIATLVWARNPSLSRDQVLQILKEASDLYPSRDSKFGFGTVDAALAVSLASR
ncbi:MAG: hypothetical protein Tsb0020_55040 [Haliangiales bacterium]